MKLGRILTILYIFDNLVLAIITRGECLIGETLSSVAWELEFDGKRMGRIMRPAIDFLASPWETNHCFKAWQTFLKIARATT